MEAEVGGSSLLYHPFSLFMKNFKQAIQSKEHLIFDLDKTLAKLLINWTNWGQGVTQVLAKYDPDFESQSGPKVYNIVNLFIDRFGTPARDDLFAFQERFEHKNYYGLDINQFLVNFVKKDQAYHKYLYTSQTRLTTYKALDQLGLNYKFEKVVTRNDVKKLKPDPDGFKLIYDRNTDKSSYLMIGDSQADKGLAENANIDFFKVDFDYYDSNY